MRLLKRSLLEALGLGCGILALGVIGLPGCTTEVHYHGPDVVYPSGSGDNSSAGTGSDASGSGSGSGSAQDAAGGAGSQDTVTPPADVGAIGSDPGPTPQQDTPAGPQFLECPDNWQPNSTGETCAPICADGYHLNDAETGCIEDEDPVPVDTGGADASGGNTDTPPDDPVGPQMCPEGWMPAAGSGDPLVCVPVQPVTLHGVVTDAATGAGIAGAWVDLAPVTDEALITDEDGHFQLDDVPFAGTVTAVYGADGYLGDTRLVSIPFIAGDGLTTQLVDASVALDAIDPDVVVDPVGSEWLAGTIYAGSA